MISRRTFVAGSVAALSAPVLVKLAASERGSRVRMRPAAASSTATTIAVDLVNNTGSDTVYA